MVVVNRGGARSSKSYSLGQLMMDNFFTMPRRQILIVRKTLPSLRASTLRLMLDLFDKYGLGGKIAEEKVGLNYWYQGSLIHFTSVDDPEKIKSTEWNDIWMEEATEFTYDDYMNLKMRLSAPTNGHHRRNQIYLSFNPIDENHWIKEKVVDGIGEESVTELQSSYKNNPFLSKDYIRLIERLIDQNPNYHRIFALGEWGKLDSLIYPSTMWSEVPEMMDGEQFYSIDFGFNMPTVVLEFAVKDEDAGVRERLHATGMTNADLIKSLDRIVPATRRRNYPIYADSAEPQRIMEINDAGFRCIGANKSVADGIDTVKRFRLNIYNGSTHVLKEIKGYSYKVNKNGDVLDEPIEFNDHCMDALRYGLHTHFFGKFKKKFRLTLV